MTTAEHAVVPAPPGEWGQAAACAGPGLDPVLREVFTTDAWTPWDVTAVTVCRACPVRPACATYAASITVESGIWGGWRRTEQLPVPYPDRGLSVAAATIR